MRTVPYLILVTLISPSVLAQTVPAVDGFNYPFGPPDGSPRCPGTDQCTGGWQNVQDFRENNHLGEDWNLGFADDDLGAPVYAIANGEVTFAAEAGTNGTWKGVIIVKHHGSDLRVPGGAPVSAVTSMYAHLDVGRINDWVTVGATVTRGQQIGVIGPTPVGSTGPHLHFEIRTDVNLGVGPGYSSDANGWTDPSDFIDANRTRSVVTWGRNDLELGNVPWPNTRFIDIAGGYAHSLGLKADGSIVAWGAHIDVPLPNTGFVGVSTRDYHSLGLKADGSIVAWGCPADQNYGQCDVPLPNAGFVAVMAGHSHSVALKDDGSIATWGANWYGQAELPSPNIGFVGIAAGCWHNVALRSDGSIVSWGCGAPVNYGQCDVPFPNTGFVQIAAGCWHSLALRADGSIVAWGCGGSQNFGQCDVPASDTRFVQVAGGLAYTIGLKAGGSIQVWGGCGDPYSPGYGPCNIPSPNTGFVAIAAGAYHGLGIRRASADFDGDGDVDLGDFAPFTEVMKGPFAAPGVSRWQIIDLDPDDDVDLRDLAVWENAFTGPRP